MDVLTKSIAFVLLDLGQQMLPFSMNNQAVVIFIAVGV